MQNSAARVIMTEGYDIHHHLLEKPPILSASLLHSLTYSSPVIPSTLLFGSGHISTKENLNIS